MLMMVVCRCWTTSLSSWTGRQAAARRQYTKYRPSSGRVPSCSRENDLRYARTALSRLMMWAHSSLSVYRCSEGCASSVQFRQGNFDWTHKWMFDLIWVSLPCGCGTGVGLPPPSFPQIDIIGAIVIVWWVRGKIIRSVLCNNCAQCNAHTYEQN